MHTYLEVSSDPINIHETFFELLSVELAASLKPPSRDKHRKASYRRTVQRDQDKGKTKIMQSGSSYTRRCSSKTF